MLREFALLTGVLLRCVATVHAQSASLGDDPKAWPDVFDGTQAGGPYAWVDGPATRASPTRCTTAHATPIRVRRGRPDEAGAGPAERMHSGCDRSD